MESFLSSFALVFIGEMGDKTQLLSLLLVARYRRPWTILAGVLLATILNHALAAGVGHWVSSAIDKDILRWLLAFVFFAFAAWVLIPDKESEVKESRGLDVFLTTTLLFFVAEMGDKTQLLTVALGARYASLLLVTVGTTLGMLAANALAVFAGQSLLQRLPMQWIRRVASVLFVIFGLLILLYE